MTRIELTALRRNWYTLLSGVLDGRTYLICKEGQVIAQLAPFILPKAPTPTFQEEPALLDPEIAATLEGLTTTFGHNELANCLGTTTLLLRRAAQTGILPDHLLPRFDFLTDLQALLLERLHPSKLRHWFYSSFRELSGQSPKTMLRGAWLPDDPVPRKIMALAAGPK